jgi:hypothetical protein
MFRRDKAWSSSGAGPSFFRAGSYHRVEQIITVLVPMRRRLSGLSLSNRRSLVSLVGLACNGRKRQLAGLHALGLAERKSIELAINGHATAGCRLQLLAGCQFPSSLMMLKITLRCPALMIDNANLFRSAAGRFKQARQTACRVKELSGLTPNSFRRIARALGLNGN